jgi:hypothetical protein
MKRFVIIVALALVAVLSFAQTTPHSLILFLDVDGEFTNEEAQMLTETLFIRLGEASGEAFGVIPTNASRPAEDDLKSFVIASGASGYLDISITGTRLNVAISANAYDVIGNSQVFSGEYKARFDRRMRVLLSFFWDGLLDDLAEAIEPRDTSVELEVTAPPGSFVEVSDGRVFVVGDTGGTELRLAAPANYAFRVSLPDHEPLSKALFLERDGQVLDLTPRPVRRVQLSAGLEWLTFPKLALSYAVLPGRLFVGAGASTLYFGITPTIDLRDEGSQLVDSFPVSFPAVFADWYFHGTSWPVKAFAGAEFYAKLNHEPSLTLDRALPGGIRARLGVEVPLARFAGVALVWVPQWFYTPDPWTFGLSLPDSDQGGYAVTRVGAFAFPVFDVNLRWYP